MYMDTGLDVRSATKSPGSRDSATLEGNPVQRIYMQQLTRDTAEDLVIPHGILAARMFPVPYDVGLANPKQPILT
jgi:hypothetical protein